MLRKTLKAIGIILLILVLLIAALLCYVTVTEYRPNAKENLTTDNNQTTSIQRGKSIHMMTWNIGYAGLGEESDFFMDGGDDVKAKNLDLVNKNIKGIISNIQKENPDILFLQEVDRDSARTYRTNQVSQISDAIPGYGHSFANNFKVNFIPYPIPPLGKVDSGLLSFARYQVDSAARISLPVPFKWPVRTVNLKRCILMQRLPVSGSDKELVLINLHLEAFDDGEGKIQQTKALRAILDQELEKGNYVIASGDFNQGFDEAKNAYPQKEGLWTPGEISSKDFSDRLQLRMDSTTPTCRSTHTEYKDADKENHQYYMLDGYIISDNIEISTVKTKDLQFKYSDHNPVVMDFRLE